MAKTDVASTKDFVDHSYFYKPYSIAAAIGFILWAAYVCWTGYWGIMKGRLPVIDIGMQLAILWWLLDTVRTKTVYRLEKDRLYMLKTGLWTKQELSIAYDDIFGVHHFKNQLMKPVTYRYTYHQYAKMDNRPIWSLLYDIGSTQKVGRVLMKASEDFWKEFEKRMPGQIRIPQERSWHSPTSLSKRNCGSRATSKTIRRWTSKKASSSSVRRAQKWAAVRTS